MLDEILHGVIAIPTKSKSKRFLEKIEKTEASLVQEYKECVTEELEKILAEKNLSKIVMAFFVPPRFFGSTRRVPIIEYLSLVNIETSEDMEEFTGSEEFEKLMEQDYYLAKLVGYNEYIIFNNDTKKFEPTEL